MSSVALLPMRSTKRCSGYGSKPTLREDSSRPISQGPRLPMSPKPLLAPASRCERHKRDRGLLQIDAAAILAGPLAKKHAPDNERICYPLRQTSDRDELE